MSKNHLAMQRRRIKLVRLKEHFGGKCSYCGYDYNYSSLDFHHIDSQEKSFPLTAVSVDSRPIEDSIEEGKKCLLLCRNCHSDLHHPLFRKKCFEGIELDIELNKRTRKCIKCGETKLLIEFGLQTTSPFKKHCLQCEREKNSKCKECGKEIESFKYDQRHPNYTELLPYCTECHFLVNIKPQRRQKCRTCGELKLLKEFRVNKKRSSGYSPKCKACYDSKMTP